MQARDASARGHPSLLALAGLSALSAVLGLGVVIAAGLLLEATGLAWVGGAVVALVVAGGVARLRGHRWSEVGLGAAWGLSAYVLLAGTIIIVATVRIGDALQ